MTRELLEQIDWNDEDVALRIESIKQSAQKYGIKISKNKSNDEATSNDESMVF